MTKAYSLLINLSLLPSDELYIWGLMTYLILYNILFDGLFCCYIANIKKKSDKLLGLVERKLVNDKFYVLRIDEQY